MTSVGLIWIPAGVSRLLNNPVYLGHSLYGKTTQKKVNGKRVTMKTKSEEQILVENTHEALVSQEDWEQVQIIKEKRASRPPSLKLGKHKFSGLIHCGICGGVHSFQTSRGNKKEFQAVKLVNITMISVNIQFVRIKERTSQNSKSFFIQNLVSMLISWRNMLI